MGYRGIMGYGVDFPLSRLGKAIILWVIRVYGLPEVWVKRVSTVARNGHDDEHGTSSGWPHLNFHVSGCSYLLYQNSYS